MGVVVATYELTRALPSAERYGLTAQARRAAVSVPANIAEGRTQHTIGGYLRHLGIASGSLAELETHLLITIRLGLISEAQAGPVLRQVAQLGRMLNVLTRRLRGRAAPSAIPAPGVRRHPTPGTRHPS